MDSSQIVTMHIQSVDQNRAIKTVKRTITELDRSTIEEQKKAIRSGYDIDILPSDLKTYGRDAKALLKELQSQNERMFLVTFLVLNTGRTEQELENNVFQASSIAQKHNCNLCRLDFQQEQGLMSSLPLADCQIEIQRGLTTSSTAIFIPFTTQELYQSGKESLYYGLNALSNNLIMVDRKKLKNPNGLILGTPGSGKSFSAKREITNAFLVTDDDIIVNDPEGEYSPLVNRLKGQVIKISPNSTQFINPMDINANYSEEDNPLSLKADFILSLCELVVGGKEGLLPVEKTVIDRCVHLIYRKYFANPCPENMPILEDLYNALLQQEEKEAHHVATALEIYVKGSLNLFNHRTNVNVNNRIVCYDIKELGKQMKKLGMLIVQDQVWGRVTANRSSGKSTRYYMDEMHLLLKEEQTAAYSVEIWKRFRKWGGIPTGLTQNVKDLLSSREVENIFENSDMIIMLNQAAGDRQILAKQLNISPHQLSYVTHSGEGEGLLFFGNVILPFVDRFPTDLELYSCEAKLKELTAQRDTLADRLKKLEKSKLAEQADVDRLEGHSLAAFFYQVIGKMDEKLDKERQEAYAARVKYDAALHDLSSVDADLAQIQNRLARLSDCERQYQAALSEKIKSIKASAHPAAQQVAGSESRIAALKVQKRELLEAINAGKTALHTVNEVLETLDNAEGWSTWDVMGGGLMADLAKYEELDDAQEQIEQLQVELRRFKTELSDVEITADLQVTVDSFLKFADFFFDGLFADWAVLDHINQAQSRVENTKDQIKRVLALLKKMREDVDVQIADEKEKQEQLAVETEL